MIKLKLIQRVTTFNSDITEETYINQWFLFGLKIYQSEYDYKNEVNKTKIGLR